MKAFIALLSILLLVATIPAPAEAGSIASSVEKAAARRAASQAAGKVGIKRTMTSQEWQVIEKAALQQQLTRLDQAMLLRIEQKYGVNIPKNQLAVTRANDAKLLSEQEHQQLLKQQYPALSEEERMTIVGNYLKRPNELNHAAGTAYINKDSPMVGRTIAHERLHQLSSPRFREKVGGDLDEGMTELFSKQVYSDLGIKDMPVAYPKGAAVAEMMASRVGEKTLARAYFQGDTAVLRQELDKQLGSGSFDKLVRTMKTGDTEAATSLLQGKRGLFGWW